MKRFFSNDVVIDVAPDKVTFTGSTGTKTWVPLVYVRSAKDGLQVHGVGEPLAGVPEGVVRVDLFGTAPVPPDADRFAVLTTFLRHGLEGLSDSLTLVHPAVLVRGVDTLSGTLNGYERGVLARALEDAGARSIAFLCA